VVDTPEEKLRGWGLNDAQIAQWNEYDAAIQAGKTPEQAAQVRGFRRSSGGVGRR